MNRIKKAFTTAELLIAMTIIGVIAALVVPPLMRDYSMRVHGAAIKEAYGTIMSAIERACVDANVSVLARTKYVIGGNESEFFKNYFKGKIDKNAFASKYSSLSGQKNNSSGYPKTSVVLSNGAAVAFYCDNGGHECAFFVDTNGPAEPNTGGVDMFLIVFAPYSNEIVLNSSSSNCKSSTVGDGCIKKLIDADWDVQKYFKSLE